MTTSMFTLTDAIRQVEEALARGERLSEVVTWVARDYALDQSLLTRRWVQFTPRPEGARRVVIGSMNLTVGHAVADGRQIAGGK